MPPKRLNILCREDGEGEEGDEDHGDVPEESTVTCWYLNYDLWQEYILGCRQ